MRGRVNPVKREERVDDTERLDWLAKQEGFGLISDDFGRWAVSGAGVQNLPNEVGKPFDVTTSFFIEAAKWHPSIREAIDAAIARQSG
jgi:hypothetical protein